MSAITNEEKLIIYLATELLDLHDTVTRIDFKKDDYDFVLHVGNQVLSRLKDIAATAHVDENEVDVQTVIKNLWDHREADLNIGHNWVPFTGEYEKRFYDIMTDKGTLFAHCWPNAGNFICNNERSRVLRVPGESVVKIRASEVTEV